MCVVKARLVYVGFSCATPYADTVDCVQETDLATAQEDVSQLQDAASTEAILSSGPGVGCLPNPSKAAADNASGPADDPTAR